MIRRNSVYGTEDRIILQVGSKYTLLGFSNEVKPRIITPSHSLDLPALFSTHLQTDPKTRRVIIIESIDMPLALKQSLARVLFGPRLHAAVGKGTGLVVDLGQSGTSCVPVFDSRPLISQASWSGIGGNVIVQHTRELLGDLATDLDDSVIQDLIVRFGRVNSGEESKEGSVMYSGFGKEFSVSVSLLSSIYDPFFLIDQDGIRIADLIVQAIGKCPIDTRRFIAANIVFCGGLAMVPGIQSRIIDQVREVTGEISVNLLPCAFKANISAWVGGMRVFWVIGLASLFGAVRASSESEVLRSNWAARKMVPDWSILAVECNDFADGDQEER